MGAVLGTIFAFAIVFGILVFIHEFGHFFAAKLVKIRVEVFSWGYGKRIFGVKKGDTDYRVSILPMGGYVRFAGEEAGQEAPKEKRELRPDEYLAKNRFQRFLVMVMGSLMNILLAVVLLAVINMAGVTVLEYLEQEPVIGWIEAGSPAESANLKIGDEILSINERKTETWNDVILSIGTKPNRLIDLEVKRGQDIFTVQLMTESKTKYERGYAGVSGTILNKVIRVFPGSPAEKAGMKAGDVILALNGGPVHYFDKLEIIEKSPGIELEFLIDREGESLILHITPRLEEGVGKIGIEREAKTVFKRYGFFSAFGQSIKGNTKLAFLLVNYVRDLLTGEASAKQVGGPIAIVNFSYSAFQMGFFAMLSFIAFVSLQLGIINLFPIPVFDGGQILVLALEGIFRRDFSPRVKHIVMQIGFAIFVFLLAFLILNDVVRNLPNGWESLLFWK
ncbi:MAG: RIP metalloprotease RseP [Candidatus Aminicenantes bacterium]|nr:MAG: RIP metalloprotease RseP [Candidatus Aminicenantes bacterium]